MREELASPDSVWHSTGRNGRTGKAAAHSGRFTESNSGGSRVTRAGCMAMKTEMEVETEMEIRDNAECESACPSQSVKEGKANKTRNEQGTNKEQTRNKQGTNKEQTREQRLIHRLD